MPYQDDSKKVEHEEKPTESSDPQDWFNLVYLTFVLQGVTIMMPWNMFITATEYFSDHKLRIRTENGTIIDSKYRQYFLNYLGLCAQIPNVTFCVLNIFFQFGQGSVQNIYGPRILFCLVLESLFMLFTMILAIVDTSEWVNLFFYLTMLTVILLNIVNGIYQNSVFGVSSYMPMKFNNALMAGLNVCGTFTSLMNIVTIWLSANKRIAAVYFFASTVSVLILAIGSFIWLQKNEYYRFYVVKDGQRKIDDTSKAVNDAGSKCSIYLYVFGYAWKQCLNVFLVMFVSLLIFPVIQSKIKPINPELFGSTKNTDKYFVAVCCFLVYNATAMFGNIALEWVIFPGPDQFWIAAVIRFIFIPFFLFCNYLPDQRKWPVSIRSDPLYIFVSLLFGFSHGYYSSLCMMFAPSSVPDSRHAGLAGMMASASLVAGIFVGVNFSFLLAKMVSK